MRRRDSAVQVLRQRAERRRYASAVKLARAIEFGRTMISLWEGVRV
jgi:hypothetical protein